MPDKSKSDVPLFLEILFLIISIISFLLTFFDSIRHAALLGTILFGLITMAFGVQKLRRKHWLSVAPIVIALILAVISYLSLTIVQY